MVNFKVENDHNKFEQQVVARFKDNMRLTKKLPRTLKNFPLTNIHLQKFPLLDLGITLTFSMARLCRVYCGSSEIPEICPQHVKFTAKAPFKQGVSSHGKPGKVT